MDREGKIIIDTTVPGHSKWFRDFFVRFSLFSYIVSQKGKLRTADFLRIMNAMKQGCFSAIMFTDVAGYMVLMGKDEDLHFEQFKIMI